MGICGSEPIGVGATYMGSGMHGSHGRNMYQYEPPRPAYRSPAPAPAPAPPRRSQGGGAGGGGGKPVTRAELARHNKPGDCWVAVSGVVYNITSFADIHPGGASALVDCTHRARWSQCRNGHTTPRHVPPPRPRTSDAAPRSLRERRHNVVHEHAQSRQSPRVPGGVCECAGPAERRDSLRTADALANAAPLRARRGTRSDRSCERRDTDWIFCCFCFS